MNNRGAATERSLGRKPGVTKSLAGHSKGPTGRRIPLLGKGGVAAPSIKCCEATLAGADGVVRSTIRLSAAERTTPAAPNVKVASHLLIRGGAPSFTKEGNTRRPRLLLVGAIFAIIS